MNHTTSTTTPGDRQPCPTNRIGVELPLATIEELDHLAALHHTSRQRVLRQLITAALLNDPPHLPAGEDSLDRLAEHAHLTRRRSLELATQRSER